MSFKTVESLYKHQNYEIIFTLWRLGGFSKGKRTATGIFCGCISLVTPYGNNDVILLIRSQVHLPVPALVDFLRALASAMKTLCLLKTAPEFALM